MNMSSLPPAAGKSSFDRVDPQKVFAELNLQPDSVLLDIACGIGNYAIAAADFIGEQGMIYAFDLWAEGIECLQRRAQELRLSRIRAAVTDVGHHLPLADASADVALLATVLHDLVVAGVAAETLQETARVLKPGGRLVVIEFDKIPGSPGPPVAIRLSSGEVTNLVSPHGFFEEHIVPVGPTTYLAKFIKIG